MKTKTTTLAGTAMAAIFAAGFVVSAQAATSAKSNANEKEITRQLNESQMQHPGVVNGQRAGSTQLSQNDTGTSSEDMNGVNGTNDQNNENTGYSPNGNPNCQFNESTATGPNEQANGANCENQNTGYTGTNDEGTGTTNENDQNNQNTGYTPGASDQDDGATQNENNPQNTGYSGEDEDNSGAEDMHENGNAQTHENEGMQSNGAPLSEEEMRSAVSLSDVPNANSELQSVQIETRGGERIGTVQSVEVNADGTARAVDADVDGRRVSLDPNNLVYLKDQNALVTDLTRPQIENLPPVNKSY